MAKEVLMPKLSSTMDEGHVVEWYKQEGDKVSVGEAIFEVMTDKIAIEVEAYDEGILLKRYVEVGEVVPVNTVIAHIGEPGEKVSQPENKNETKNEPEVETKKEEDPKIIPSATTSNKDVRATPSARKLVKEHNLDLSEVFNIVQPEIRLHHHDVETFIQQTAKTTKATQIETQQDKIIPWSGIRKSVADQMFKSASTIPHVTLNAQVNVDEMIKLRSTLLETIKKETDVRLTYTHMIAFFVSRVLAKHPGLNAHALDDGIHFKKQVNLGIATALSNGLIVPVVSNASEQKLNDITKKITELTQKAKVNTLTSSELRGGTFTITSLGGTAVTDFNPIINIPEVAILGIGNITDTLKLSEVGVVEKSNILTISLSFDHRAIDGYQASLFLTDLAELIENPAYLIKY